MKKVLFLILLLMGFGLTQAQNSYTVYPIPFNPDPFAVGTPSGVAFDDTYGGIVALPFSFCFYDQSYAAIVIGSNGIVTFDTAQANLFCPWVFNQPIPASAVTDKTIMAPMSDLNPGMGGSITYDVHGVAPYRRFIVSYYQVPMFSCSTILFSEQVILYETTNIIETHILDKPVCGNWNNGNAIHGIQVDSVTAFPVPGRNYPSQWLVSNDGYRFQPVGACAGPPQTDSVNGKVYADYNNNCTQDPGEFPLANRAILANGGQFYGWSNMGGHYSIGMVAGTYAISEYLTSPFYASNCTPGGVYNVVLNGTVFNNADFADSAAIICSDVSVSIGSAGLRRCRQSLIGVTYCNNGTYPDSNVVVTVVLNDSITIDSANMAYTTIGLNTYAFSVGNLMPGQCGNINLHCAIGCDTAGTVYCFSASIAGTYALDCNNYNNSDNDCQSLLAPLDPNEKTVAAQDFLTHGYVRADNIDNDDELVYMVHFQNVGTAMSQDVVIRDTLDPSLSPESIQPGAASALYNYAVVGNVVIFRFENINLPDSNNNEPGSHGFVKFSIQQRPGNMLGTVIRNQASIYFDFEAPVVTNQTVNTIPLASAVHVGLQDVAQVYPNPGKDQLIVQRTVDRTLTFVMYDIAGKEMRRVELSGVRTVVPTADLEAGVYLYRLVADGQMLEAGKWMKQ